MLSKYWGWCKYQYREHPKANFAEAKAQALEVLDACPTEVIQPGLTHHYYKGKHCQENKCINSDLGRAIFASRTLACHNIFVRYFVRYSKNLTCCLYVLSMVANS